MSDIETPSGKNEETENFPVARFIRSDLREHVVAYYKFARAADDIGDNPLLDPEDKITRLDAFARALLKDDDNSIPSVIPLRESLKATKVDPAHALDLLIAFKQDAVKLRYENWDELMTYCRYSAAPVGRYVLALHGIGREAWPANDALCSALQILNHIQDCADDYRELDRVYAPLDILAKHGADPSNLSGESASPSLRAALLEMLEKTKPLVAEGVKLPGFVPDPMLRFNTAVIGVVAESLTSLLLRRDPLCDNVKLSKWAKAVAVAKGLLRAIVTKP